MPRRPVTTTAFALEEAGESTAESFRPDVSRRGIREVGKRSDEAGDGRRLGDADDKPSTQERTERGVRG